MKRLFDVVVSGIGIIVLIPIYLIIAILIVIDSSGGIFFRGVRVGKNGKQFRIFKFRSMLPDCEGKGKWNVGADDDRITKVGKILRKTKLDELPQLFNVFIGNMSFVGPRPELQHYVDMYQGEEVDILSEKPGITDWASLANFDQFIGFTNAEDPDEYYLKYVRPLKLKLQLYYHKNHNVFSDIQCILWTVFKVLLRFRRLPKNIQLIVDDYFVDINKDDAGELNE